jgi:hypothetical protein
MDTGSGLLHGWQGGRDGRSDRAGNREQVEEMGRPVRTQVFAYGMDRGTDASLPRMTPVLRQDAEGVAQPIPKGEGHGMG